MFLEEPLMADPSEEREFLVADLRAARGAEETARENYEAAERQASGNPAFAESLIARQNQDKLLREWRQRQQQIKKLEMDLEIHDRAEARVKQRQQAKARERERDQRDNDKQARASGMRRRFQDKDRER